MTIRHLLELPDNNISLFIEHVIANHFYTLLDILLSTGKNQNIELTPSIVTKVFRALEWGILGEEVGRSNALF